MNKKNDHEQPSKKKIMWEYKRTWFRFMNTWSCTRTVRFVLIIHKIRCRYV
ncbi:hypothetical protein Hanom_Chr09g00863021 [Helianthus anomalus]